MHWTKQFTEFANILCSTIIVRPAAEFSRQMNGLNNWITKLWRCAQRCVGGYSPSNSEKLKLIWFHFLKPRLMPDLPKPIPLTGFRGSCMKCTLQGPTGPSDSLCCESKSKWTPSMTKEGFCVFTAIINTESWKRKPGRTKRQVSTSLEADTQMYDCCLWNSTG